MANQQVAEVDRSLALKSYYKHRDKRLAASSEYQKRTKTQRAKYMRDWRKKLKDEVFVAYGNKCSCCQTEVREFLTIDHIEGRGLRPFRGNYNKLFDFKTTTDFYRWLKANNFPKDDYRLLCMNCNFSIGMWGYCPHTQTGGIQ